MLVLVVDLRHAKQVDLEKIKESPVYNFKVQFEPQVSFLDNLDKLAGENNNFDIKDLIQNLNSVEEKKPQATNSPTDVDDLEFALPTVLPPITPPVLTTLPTVPPTPPTTTTPPASTEMTTVFAPVTTTATTDLPEVPTELPPSMPPPSEPIELPPSEPALVEAEESETEVVATTVSTRGETEGVKPVEREEESGWTISIPTPAPASNHPPAFRPPPFNFMSSMFPFQAGNVGGQKCQWPCHGLMFFPQFVFQPRYLMPGLYGYRWPGFGGGAGGYNYNRNINNRWRP